MIENVPVNYSIRFSDPVTALAARCVRYGVGSRPHLAGRSSRVTKTHSFPAIFSNGPLYSFPPSSRSCTGPGHTSGRAEPYLLYTGPWSLQTGVTRPVKTYLSVAAGVRAEVASNAVAKRSALLRDGYTVTGAQHVRDRRIVGSHW